MVGFEFSSAVEFGDRFLSQLNLDGDFFSLFSSGVFVSKLLAFISPISNLASSSRPFGIEYHCHERII